MLKFNSKTLIATSAVVIVIVGGVVYYFVQKPAPPSKPTNKAPAKAVALDPTAVVRAESAYVNTNKTVSLRGTVLQNGQNYMLISHTVTSGKTVGAVQLDFSKTNINPAKYAINDPSSSSAKGLSNTPTLVTVTGQLTQAKGGPLVLTVTSISH